MNRKAAAKKIAGNHKVSPFFALGLVLACLLATPAMAADEPDPFNVDFFVGWDGCYRPLEWTPIDVGVATTLKEPFGGIVTLSAGQDSMTTMIVNHKMVVTQDAPIRVPLVVRLAHDVSSCDLSIYDVNGKRAFSRSYNLSRYSSGTRMAVPLRISDYLVGVVGRKGFGLGKLPEMSGAAGNGVVYVRDKLPKLLPWDWTGYASLDVLVLYNPEWDQIGPVQTKAIHEFVSNGGRCLIVLGGRGLPTEGPIADMIPFKLQTPQKVTLNERDLPYDGTLSRQATVTAWGLGEAGQKFTGGWTTNKFKSTQALLAVGPHGYGKLAVLAFDPSELPDPKQANNCRFWAQLLNYVDQPERRINYQPSPNQDPGYYYGQSGRDADNTNRVLGHLLDIQELRPLSIWWVIGLLALLAVLLGPVDYLVLKKLDRLPLTWITSAVIIILFTVGAYFGVQAIRAGSMQVRAVTIVDAMQDDSGKTCESWSTSFCGIFAPASDRYKFQGVPGRTWWSAQSPVQSYGPYGGQSLSSRQLFCLQEDGSNIPQEVPINIWSMQCLVSESAMDTSPLVAEVTSTGRGKYTAKITNNTKTPVVSGCVRVGGTEIQVGRIEPGQTQTFDKPSGGGTFGWQPFSNKQFSRNLMLSNMTGAYGILQRTAGIEERMQDSRTALVCVQFEGAPLPYKVVPSDYKVDHVMIARLLVPVGSTSSGSPRSGSPTESF